MGLVRLEDVFSLEQELGRGGFGVVRLGRLRATGELAAIKIPHKTPDPESLARIEREARLMRQLQHPNLARFLGAFQVAGDQVALAYELIDGVPLSRAHAGEAPRPEVLVGWVRQAGAGLDALHGAGLVHRDVKPENLMADRRGDVRVIDFGLVRATAAGETVTATGILLGTPHFMPPEAFQGASLGPAADRFGLAATAYWLLSGRPPFPGESPAEIARRQLEAPPAIPGALGERRAMASFFARALAADPRQRPESCGELATALAEAVGGRRDLEPSPPGTRATRIVEPAPQTLAATPPNSRGPDTPRRVSERRRARRTRALAAFGLIALLGGGLAATLSRRPLSDQDLGLASSTSGPPAASGLEVPALLVLRESLSDLQLLAIEPRGLIEERRIFERGGDEKAESFLELIGPDPVFWPLVRARLPEWEAVEAWVQQDGDLQALPAEVRVELVATHRTFQELGMVSPLARVIPPEPNSGDSIRPLVLLLAGLGTDPAALESSPRARRALQALSAVLRAIEEKSEGLRRGELQLPPRFQGMGSFAISLSDNYDVHAMCQRVMSDPVNRRALFGFLRAEQELLLRGFWEAGRAVRMEPGGADSVAMAMHQAVLARLGQFSRPLAAGLALEELLGPQGKRSPARALLELTVGLLVFEGAHVLEVRAEKREVQLAALIELAREAAEPEEGARAMLRRDVALEFQVRLLVAASRPGEAVRVCRDRLREAVRAAPPGHPRARLLRCLLVQVQTHRDTFGTPPEELRRLLEVLLAGPDGEDLLEGSMFIPSNPILGTFRFQAASLEEVRRDLEEILGAAGSGAPPAGGAPARSGP